MDKLLNRLYKDDNKHQVLIFSNFVTILDILEDFCNYRKYKYCRIEYTLL
jgi:SWI/SNF-related matrix-associated actin-dependent regulator of chromatin subfamily A member 5